jgi:hypothetical protein
MTKRSHRIANPQHPTLQLQMAFTTRGVLDPRQREDVVSLLSRLLLQLSIAQNQDGVDDELA